MVSPEVRNGGELRSSTQAVVTEQPHQAQEMPKTAPAHTEPLQHSCITTATSKEAANAVTAQAVFTGTKEEERGSYVGKPTKALKKTRITLLRVVSNRANWRSSYTCRTC